MAATSLQHGPVQINWGDSGRVMVMDRDKHRFLMTSQQAADACAAGMKQLVWQEEFDRLMLHVHAWSKARQAAATYLAVVDRQIVIFVVPRGRTMDFQLSDEIAALEVSLHHDFANCRCEVRQIPGHTLEALSTFLDLEQAFILYGKPPTTSGAVGA